MTNDLQDLYRLVWAPLPAEYRLKMITKLVENETVSPWQDGLEA